MEGDAQAVCLARRNAGREKRVCHSTQEGAERGGTWLHGTHGWEAGRDAAENKKRKSVAGAGLETTQKGMGGEAPRSARSGSTEKY